MESELAIHDLIGTGWGINYAKTSQKRPQTASVNNTCKTFAKFEGSSEAISTFRQFGELLLWGGHPYADIGRKHVIFSPRIVPVYENPVFNLPNKTLVMKQYNNTGEVATAEPHGMAAGAVTYQRHNKGHSSPKRNQRIAVTVGEPLYSEVFVNITVPPQQFGVGV
ncbi:hypothetical protein J6590_100117 [Homalodisca vitripennis]|nr:hypothetical protein J6590_100117 [Homalodisca vitripennis]